MMPVIRLHVERDFHFPSRQQRTCASRRGDGTVAAPKTGSTKPRGPGGQLTPHFLSAIFDFDPHFSLPCAASGLKCRSSYHRSYGRPAFETWIRLSVELNKKHLVYTASGCRSAFTAAHIPDVPTCRSSTRPLLTVPYIQSDFESSPDDPSASPHQLCWIPYQSISSPVQSIASYFQVKTKDASV